MSQAVDHLSELAATVLQPGFEGTTPPDWIRRWLGEGLGGVVLFARNIRDHEQVARLTATLRAERPDVIVATDEESGDVTRLESARGSSRPGNLALGVIDDPTLTEEIARDLGTELAAVGINLDYAPAADVNSNPDNPVIGVRSFGADPDLVARHTAAWVRGLQSAGVAACAKHFPGHGDTDVDSHLDLPRIVADPDRLATTELRPFRAAIDAGVQAVMTGHLLVPALDARWPATLSRRMLTDLLRDELGFSGLVITDGIEMRALTRRYGFAEAAVRALIAGVDAICVGGDHAGEEDARRIRDAIIGAVRAGILAEERLAEAAKRVGQLAAWAIGAGAPGGSGGSTGDPVGLVAARRAVRLTLADGDGGLPLTTAVHVVEFAAPHNIAAGTETPWGIAEPLTAALPGTTTVRLRADQLTGHAEALAEVAVAARDRPLVLTVRDLHRHPWMSAAVDRLLADRPDAIVVELGLPGRVVGAVHVATYGASRALARAAVELLTGHRR